VAVILFAAGSAACSASPTPAPSTNSSRASIPEPSADATPLASLLAVTNPSAEPSPTEFAPPTSLPAGNWIGIHWTKAAGQAYVWQSPPIPVPSDPNVTNSGWSVFGWSKGYAAFYTVITTAADGSSSEVTSTAHSIDGLRWQSGGDFTCAADPGCDNGVVGVVEGPAGLLAYSGAAVDCSQPGSYAWPLAVSQDGGTWTPVDPNLGSIQMIDAGGAGYVAIGTSGVFTSADGRAWIKAQLKGRAFRALDGIESGTAFGRGFVISGETFGPSTEGCGSGPTDLYPSVWWSGDGKTWIRDQVPNVVPGSDVKMDVCRLSDQLLLASETDGSVIPPTWASTDGHVWRRVAFPGLYGCPSALQQPQVFISGAHDLILSADDSGPQTIVTIAADLKVVTLVQDGAIPDWKSSNTPVLGPAGLIVTDDSGNTFVGVPVAG
jgi:hypothetical protein